MKSFTEKVPYWVVNLITIVSGIFTIIISIYGLIDSIFGNIFKEGKGNANNSYLILVIVVLIIFNVVVFSKMFKFNKLFKMGRENFSCNFYSFLRISRNTYFKVLCDYKNNKNEKKACLKLLTETTKGYFQESLNFLCKIMKEITGCDVSACIKVIDSEDGNPENLDPEKALVTTFARSEESDPKRESLDSDTSVSRKLIQNTDFCDIITKRLSCFYQENLVEYANNPNNAYKNTTPNYASFYVSTIVVPIRAKRELLFYKEDNNNYDIIGYLCIDSLSKNAFLEREPERRINERIMKAFSAEMYIILSKYKYYLKKIS